MIHRLFRGEFGKWWQDPESVAGQENNIGRMAGDAGYFGILNKFDRVGAAGVLRYPRIREVHLSASVIENDVLQEGSSVRGPENPKFGFCRHIDGLRRPPAFDIKD